jgi:hypothetical protein
MNMDYFLNKAVRVRTLIGINGYQSSDYIGTLEKIDLDNNFIILSTSVYEKKTLINIEHIVSIENV